MIDKFRSIIKRYSPFSFSTLKELPRPTLAFLLTPLFFILFHGMMETLIDCKPVPPIKGDLGAFLYNERPSNPRKCEVLILGSSANGLGLYKDLFQEKLGVPVGKVAVSDCWLWEADRILKKYPEETQHAKLVFLDFRSHLMATDLHEFKFQNGNTFLGLGDPLDSSPENIKIMTALNVIKPNQNNVLTPLSFMDYLLPTKTSVTTLFSFNENLYLDYHEPRWNDKKYRQRRQRDQDELEEKTRNISGPPETEASMAKYSQETEKALWNFIEYCQSRGIFVVLNITPSWYGNYPYHMPEAENLGEPEKRFVDLCRRLNEHPNCRLLYLRDFHEIDPDAIDREYMFDYIHMTKKGATVYTNWVTEQIFNDRKIMAAIYPSKKCERILAQRKSQTPSKASDVGLENVPVKIAVPENQTIR